MSGYYELLPQSPFSAFPDGRGSSYSIGDGVALTALHNLYFINYRRNSADRNINQIAPSGTYNILRELGTLYYGTSYRDELWNSYRSHVHQSISSASTSIEEDSANVGIIKARDDVKKRDMGLIEKGDDVGPNDAGVVVFLNSADMTSPDFGLSTDSDIVKVGRYGSTTHGVSDARVSYTPGSYYFVHGAGDPSAYASPGDSGSGVVVDFTSGALALDNKKFILGFIDFIVDEVSGSTVAGAARSIHFKVEDFKNTMDFLEGRQRDGDRTGDEPTNLIVGSASNDSNVLGTYRPDIILGRSGDDIIKDGDVAGDRIWANDRLFGGDGNDSFSAGNGSDLIHGGDFRKYGGDFKNDSSTNPGGDRTWTIEGDGDGDNIDYSVALSRQAKDAGVELRIGEADNSKLPTWVYGDETDKAYAVYAIDRLQTDKKVADKDKLGIDALISVEKITLTGSNDILTLNKIGGVEFAGSDKKGGVYSISFGGNDTADGSAEKPGDLIDARNLSASDGVIIDLAAGKVAKRTSPGTADTEAFLMIKDAESAYGGKGDDELTGDDGANRLDGGKGADTVKGGKGNDTIVSQADGANDTLDGGDGEDTIAIKYDDGNSAITLGAAGSDGIIGTGLKVDLADETDTFTNFEKVSVQAGGGVDTFSIVADGVGVVTSKIGRIDLGAQPAGNFDRIDLSSWTTDVNVNLAAGTVSWGSNTLTVSNAEEALGGSGNDILTAGSGSAGGAIVVIAPGSQRQYRLVGGGGVDTLTGGSGNDILYSNDQADTEDGVGDFLDGGDGVDTYHVGGGDQIVLSGIGKKAETVIYNGITLNGGVRQGSASDPTKTYKGSDGTKYTLDSATGNLVVTPAPSGAAPLAPMARSLAAPAAAASDAVTITGYRNGDAQIYLRDEDEDKPHFDPAERNKDPLIIDLDKDGSVAHSLGQSNAWFDLDNDGFAEHTAWANSTDGMLVIDKDGDGQITKASELFGATYVDTRAYQPQNHGASGFADLKQYDSNVDGKIDAQDAAFLDMRVWIDRDGNGVSSGGELLTLAEAGVSSISLTFGKKPSLDSFDDFTVVDQASKVSLTDGSETYVYDAYLTVDHFDTREDTRSVEISAEIEKLPFLVGRGTVSDLDVAMARDPALEAMIREFASLNVSQVGEVLERVEAIVLRWTGADAVAPDSRGININARWLTALEKIAGTSFSQLRVGSNPRADAASILSTDWNNTLSRVAAQLLGQTQFGQDLLPGLSFAASAFYSNDGTATLESVFASLEAKVPVGIAAGLGYWHTMGSIVERYLDELGVTTGEFLARMDQALDAAGLPLRADQVLDAKFAGASSDIDRSSTQDWSQLHLVGDGVSELNGSAKHDEWLFDRVSSDITVSGFGGGGDEFWFADRARGEATISVTLGDAPSFAIAQFDFSIGLAEGGSIRFKATLTDAGLSVPVESVRFGGSDFSRVTDLLVGADLNYGPDGKILVGDSASTFEITGTAGSDLLLGFGTADQYVFSMGQGHDRIVDMSGSMNSTLKIATVLGNVRFAAAGTDGRDLDVTNVATGDIMTVAGQMASLSRQVDRFEFSDGQVLTADEVRLLATTGTPGADKIVGSFFDDLVDGRGGSDILAGGQGDDRYLFNIGYGSLTIEDSGAENSIIFGAGISEANLDPSFDGNDLILAVAGTSDSLRLKNAASSVTIKTLQFADATNISLAALVGQALARAGTTSGGTIYGTVEADTLTGTSGNDRIDGNGGSDQLRGLDGSDVYVIRAGRMQIVEQNSGVDVLYAGPEFSYDNILFSLYGVNGNTTNQLRIRFAGTSARISTNNSVVLNTGLWDTNTADDIEGIQFSDGRYLDLTQARVLTGTAGNDLLYNFGSFSGATFNPGAGNDRIFAGGNDTVNLAVGFGDDVIYGTSSGVNVRFTDRSLTGSNPQFSRVGEDLVVSFTGSADKLTVKDAFGFKQTTINSMVFGLGGSLNYAGIAQKISIATAGDDLMFGPVALNGGAGNDTLIGDNGYSGIPNAGSNVYTFGRGYGHDVIKERDGLFGNALTGEFYTDTLNLTGLLQSDVSYSRDPLDPYSIVITIKDTGETVTLDGTPWDDLNVYNDDSSVSGDAAPSRDQRGAHWIERIVFADGTVLHQNDLVKAILAAEKTDGADTLYNFGASSIDTRNAVYDGGMGNDTIVTPFDIVTVKMTPTSGNDVILSSNEGRLTVRVLTEGLDTAAFTAVTETRDGVDYTILSAGNGPTLTIQGKVDTSTADKGITLNVTNSTGAAIAVRTDQASTFAGGGTFIGTSGDDRMVGSAKDPTYFPINGQIPNFSRLGYDTFQGNAGNDTFNGRGGVDTIIFKPGDGLDTLGVNKAVFGSTTTSAGYVISLQGGIARSDVSFSWADEDSGKVLISTGGIGDGIIVDLSSIQRIDFGSGYRITANGNPLTGNEVLSVATLQGAPTAGAETIRLYAGQQVDSLGGDDRIRSLDGQATLQYGQGDGNDRFGGYAGTNGLYANTVSFTGINSLTELAFARGGDGQKDLVVTMLASGETLTIENQFGVSAATLTNAVVTQFTLASGAVYSWQQIHSMVGAVSSLGDGIVTTNSSGGILSGGAGFDTLKGGSGADTYEFGRGFDQDTIVDKGGDDVVRFGAGITLDDVYFSRTGNNGGDLLIEVTGEDRLTATVTGQFVEGSPSRIENFAFADGVILSAAEVEHLILDSLSTRGADGIDGFFGSDRIDARDGNDTITGFGGDDTIDGGTGRDTAVLRGSASQYEIVTVGGTTTVRDLVIGRDGTDTLINVEDLRFAGDGSIIHLAPINAAPFAGAGSFVGTEDAELVISRASLLSLTSDADGDPLTFQVANAVNGQVWIDRDGNVRFKSSANYNGPASFDYSVTDPSGATASGHVAIDLSASNDAPVVGTPIGAATYREDGLIAFSVPQDAFNDVDGDPLVYSATMADGSPLPSWLSMVDGTLRGTPPTNFNGNLNLSITADDGQQSITSGMTLVISPVNDAPMLIAPLQDLLLKPGSAVELALPPSLFSDPEGDPFVVQVELADGQPLPSWLQFADGVLRGTAPVDFVGTLDISVIADDGADRSLSILTLEVRPNSAPVVVNAPGALLSPEDTAISVALPSNIFSDPDGDSLTISAALTDGSPLSPWLQFDGSTFSGTPPQDFYGTIGLLITASDGTAQTSANLLLTIAPVNDAPVLTTALTDVSSPEDTALSFVLPSGSFSDVDNAALTLSAVQSNGVPLPTWLSFDAATRTFSGTPPQDFNGFVDVRVIASDGALSASDDFRLTITPVNDAPVLLQPLAAITSPEDQALSAVLPQGAFGDVDGDTLSYSATLANGSPLPTWLQLAAGTFTGTPPSNFNGSLDLLVSASDGQLSTSAALRLTVTPVNDAPVLSIALPDHTVSAGTAIDWPIPAGSFSDVDGDRLALTATLANGTALPNWLTFDGQHFTGTVPAGFTGILDVKVTASDGSLSVSDIFQIAAVSGNHAPDAVDDGLFVTDQAQQLVIAAADLLANDSDPDGDPLQIVSVQGASHGTVSIAQNGNIVYSADGAYVGTDSFTYTLSDGRAVDSATVAVRVDSPFATWSQGTAGNDKLFGNMAIANQINGLGGNDQIKGGQLDDWLAGGDGDDHLIGLGGNDHFWGGAGNDVLNGNAGTDVAHYFGLRSSYSVVTVNGSVTVVDNAPNVDGNDGTDTISSIEQLVFKNGETASVISPIILDLDGKGVRTLTSVQSRATYDLNGDGQRDDTSWIGGTEGFLFLDRDRNGTLSGANEMSFTDDVPGAASDLAGLRAFDSNGDGRLSADDAQFAQFKIWRDANGNGTVDRGEVLNLGDAGVKAINLTATAVNAATAFGDVAVVARGSYERTDGTNMELLDAALTYFSAASNPATRRPLINRGWKIGEPEPQIDVNPGLDDVITALSTQTGTNAIAALAGLSDAEAFARFASNQGEPASASTNNQSVSVQHSQELPAMAVIADTPFFGQNDAASTGEMVATATDSARLLALLRQDMAGFGASSAMDRINWKTDALNHGGGLAYL